MTSTEDIDQALAVKDLLPDPPPEPRPAPPADDAVSLLKQVVERLDRHYDRMFAGAMATEAAAFAVAQAFETVRQLANSMAKQGFHEIAANLVELIE